MMTKQQIAEFKAEIVRRAEQNERDQNEGPSYSAPLAPRNEQNAFNRYMCRVQENAAHVGCK